MAPHALLFLRKESLSAAQTTLDPKEHAHEGQKVRSAPRIPNIHRPADQTRGTAPSAAWRLTQMLVRVSSHSCPV